MLGLAIGAHGRRIVIQIDSLNDARLMPSRKRLMLVTSMIVGKLAMLRFLHIFTFSSNVFLCIDIIAMVWILCIGTALLAWHATLQRNSAYLMPGVMIIGNIVTSLSRFMWRGPQQPQQQQHQLLYQPSSPGGPGNHMTPLTRSQTGVMITVSSPGAAATAAAMAASPSFRYKVHPAPSSSIHQ
jgi:hypothetical protein